VDVDAHGRHVHVTGSRQGSRRWVGDLHYLDVDPALGPSPPERARIRLAPMRSISGFSTSRSTPLGVITMSVWKRHAPSAIVPRAATPTAAGMPADRSRPPPHSPSAPA